MTEQRNRAEDKGWLCVVALRASQFWDFVDRRQLDAHAVSVVALAGTIMTSIWGWEFAWQSTRPGLEVAAILAALGGPWAALQAAVIKFVFDARASSFESRRGGGHERSVTDTTSRKTADTEVEGKK